jgi:hypothetical protein
MAVPLLAAVVLADEPKKDTKKEIVIAIPVTANAGDNIAEWLRVGSSVNIVLEEPAAPPARTVFEGRRVSAIAEREKGGLTVSVYLTPAQAKALEALMGAGKVKVEEYQEGLFGKHAK